MISEKTSSGFRTALLSLACSGTALMAMAQQPGKSISVDAVPAFQPFQSWVINHTVVTTPTTSPVVQLETVRPRVPGVNAPVSYQPQPVIMGLPELPLLGISAPQAAVAWATNANYQGVHVRLWVLDTSGQRHEARSLAQPLKAGERFKVQITATFDAVVSLDQVLGDAWYGQRTGQVYPQAGMSVALMSGEPINLPLGNDEYFLMNPPVNERLVLAVRHAKALGNARSDQPVYRQDMEGGSGLLQLVPSGSYPSVEHLISQRL